MRLRLIIRPEAEAELAEAFDWYERRMPVTPKSGRIASDGPSPRLLPRRLPTTLLHPQIRQVRAERGNLKIPTEN